MLLQSWLLQKGSLCLKQRESTHLHPSGTELDLSKHSALLTTKRDGFSFEPALKDRQGLQEQTFPQTKTHF